MGDWILVLLYPVMFGFLLVALTPLFLWRVADTIGTDLTLYKQKVDFDCIIVHTACPKRDVDSLPLRGRLIILAALTIAKWSRKPIILAVGKTVKGYPLKECEIYARFLREKHYFTNVILGTDPDARDTKREAIEAHRLCLEHGFKKPLRVCGRYHLARVSWHWNRVNRIKPGKWLRTVFWYFFDKSRQEVLETRYMGVYCPGQLYTFEVPFFWVDMSLELGDLYLPKRLMKGIRNLMLHLINRKG